MLLFEIVLSMDRVLVQFISMMLGVLGMNQDLSTAPIEASTIVPIQKMLESSAKLSVS